MSLSDFVAFAKGKQHMPTSQGRIIKGYAMTGSQEKEPLQWMPGTFKEKSSEDKVNRRRDAKRLSERRSRLRKRGVSKEQLARMTEEEMANMIQHFVQLDYVRRRKTQSKHEIADVVSRLHAAGCDWLTYSAKKDAT